MAEKMRFEGKKDARRFIKEIDISEETYQAIKNAKKEGNSVSFTSGAPLLEDAYNMFGGNCFRGVVTLAIELLLEDIAGRLEEAGCLVVSKDKASEAMKTSILPLMCTMVVGDDVVDSLSFFNEDAEDICDNVCRCLMPIKAEFFRHGLYDIHDERPAGEIAVGLLMYISSESAERTNNDIVN